MHAEFEAQTRYFCQLDVSLSARHWGTSLGGGGEPYSNGCSDGYDRAKGQDYRGGVMLSVIDPGEPASISGYVVNEHIARLSNAALKRQPLQPVMDSIVKELGFDSFMYGMSADPNPT